MVKMKIEETKVEEAKVEDKKKKEKSDSKKPVIFLYNKKCFLIFFVD